jgi:hypothetical protein
VIGIGQLRDLLAGAVAQLHAAADGDSGQVQVLGQHQIAVGRLVQVLIGAVPAHGERIDQPPERVGLLDGSPGGDR